MNNNKDIILKKIDDKIKNWKKSLHKNPSLEDGYIEELESHLRDKIEDYTNKGMNEEDAFKKAMEEIGEPGKIGEEFFKTDTINKVSGRPPWQTPGWMPELLFNYAKIAFRNLKKHITYSFINIFSLALSIAVFLLILLYINQELSYDRYHTDNDRIFMVSEQIKTSSDLLSFAPIGWPVAPALKDNFPQVKYTARVFKVNAKVQIQHKNKIFYESGFIYAENDLFNILTFDVLRGNIKNLLAAPNTIVITDKESQRYFGNENPVGKILKVDNTNFTITGVIKSLPPNTHLKFNFVASLKTIENPDWFSNWFGTECYTYIKLNKGVNVHQFEQQITDIAHKYVGKQLKSFDSIYRYHLIPISKVHWLTKYQLEPEPPGNFNNILLFGSIAIFILLIASINYMNLSTAQSMIRAKEVGLRKVAGAGKNQLVFQFLGESLIVTVFASLIGIIIVLLITPYLNHFTQTAFLESDLFHPRIVSLLIATILIVGLGAGMYPALVIVAFKPITILHGKFYRSTKGKSLRKILVVFQFALTVLMIVGTIVISKQINFMKNQDLGFEKSKKLVIPALGGADLTKNYRDIRNAMLNIPGINTISLSSSVPGTPPESYNIVLAGHRDNVNLAMDHIFIDPGFVPAYNLKILAGRNFNYNMKSDEASGKEEETVFLINESAMKRCGWNNPGEALGAYLITGAGGRKGKIIGVVKNFHYEGLQNKIKPVVFEWLTYKFKMITLNISVADISNTMGLIKNKWKQFFPNSLMNSFFLDSEFDRQYTKVEQTAKLTGMFTIIGIIIACAGLLGLVSFIVEQRTKEIGIRKTLGASSTNILKMLTSEFIRWIIIGNLIGLPAAYFIMTRWLQNFAYRIELTPVIFIIAFSISIVFAFTTILYKTFRASIENPIKSLRYE